MSSYPILLGRVVIDANNRAIRLNENGVTETLNIALGTYAIEPNALDSLNLLSAIATALNSHSGTNTYTATVGWSADPAGVGAVVTITSAGANSFAILWLDALTTFDQALLGFTNVNTVFDGAPKIGTLVPSCVWVSDQPYEFWEPMQMQEAFVVKTPASYVRGGVVGGPWRKRRLSMKWISYIRTFGRERLGNVLTQAQAIYLGGIMEFVALHSVGTPVLVYFVDATGLVLASPSTVTADGGCYWLFDEDTARTIEPSRHEPGLSLYQFSIAMHVVPS